MTSTTALAAAVSLLISSMGVASQPSLADQAKATNQQTTAEVIADSTHPNHKWL